jgi:hypothetical protein
LSTLAPPSPPIPRREFDLRGSNVRPPGWEARRPIPIEALFREGVYAALEEWLADSELELLKAAAKATLPPGLAEWQAACAARLEQLSSPSHPGRLSAGAPM